jgi:hypothetical protein
MGKGRFLVETLRVVSRRDKERAGGAGSETVEGDECRRCGFHERTDDGVKAFDLLLETLDPPGQFP